MIWENTNTLLVADIHLGKITHFRKAGIAVPAAAISLAGIAAVSSVAETNVIVRSAPPQRTTEPLTKSVPVQR